MKSLLVLALLLTSVAASAKSIRLFTVRSGYADEIQTEFKVNKDLGRAWVNVMTITDYWDEDEDITDNYIKVEGLSYDKDTQEVVYTEQEATVVCASIRSRGRGIFRHLRMDNTSECSFRIATEFKDVDDGFYVRTKKYDVVYLDIPSL